MLSTARLLLAAACWHRRAFAAGAEVSRKLLHVAIGTTFLALPWLFHDPRPVLVLCGGFVGLLWLRRMMPAIDGGASHVIYGVGRRSVGEYLFPFAAAILFLISDGDPLRFCAPLALLTYADAAAALVGSRYGTRKIRLPGGGCKSVEGSAAFFVTALLVTQLCLNLLTPIPPLSAWFVAVTIASAGTVLELLLPHGLDNLAVPLVGAALLEWLV
jgi:phytol kinase